MITRIGVHDRTDQPFKITRIRMPAYTRPGTKLLTRWTRQRISRWCVPMDVPRYRMLLPGMNVPARNLHRARSIPERAREDIRAQICSKACESMSQLAARNKKARAATARADRRRRGGLCL